MSLPDRAATTIIIAAISAPLLLAIIFSMQTVFDAPKENIVKIDAPLRGALYTGGATLMGLAAFGAVLGAGVIGAKNETVRSHGVTLMGGGAVGVILAQLFLMMYTCCIGFVSDMWMILGWILVTAVYSILTIIGFIHMLDIRLKW